MLRKLLLLVAGVIIVLTTASCSSPYEGPGTVVERRHSAASSSLVPMWTGKAMMLVPRTKPERWSLDVQEGNPDKTIVNFSVDKTFWNTIKVGDVVTIHDGKIATG